MIDSYKKSAPVCNTGSGYDMDTAILAEKWRKVNEFEWKEID